MPTTNQIIKKFQNKLVELFDSKTKDMLDSGTTVYRFKKADIQGVLDELADADDEIRKKVLELYAGGTDLDAQKSQAKFLKVMTFYVEKYLTEGALAVQSANVARQITEKERPKKIKEAIAAAKKTLRT